MKGTKDEDNSTKVLRMPLPGGEALILPRRVRTEGLQVELIEVLDGLGSQTIN